MQLVHCGVLFFNDLKLSSKSAVVTVKVVPPKWLGQVTGGTILVVRLPFFKKKCLII